MCNPDQRRTIAIEIKGTNGKLTQAQKGWLWLLQWCGIPAYAFWPHHLEEAIEVLRGNASGPGRAAGADGERA